MQLPVSMSPGTSCRSSASRLKAHAHARPQRVTPVREARATVAMSASPGVLELAPTDRYERILKFVEDNSLDMEEHAGPAVQRALFYNSYDEDDYQSGSPAPLAMALDQQAQFHAFSNSSSGVQEPLAAVSTIEQLPAASLDTTPAAIPAFSSSAEPLTAASTSHSTSAAARHAPFPAAAARHRQKRFVRLSRAQRAAKQRASGAQSPLATYGDLEVMEAWMAPTEAQRDAGQYALSAAEAANSHLANGQRWLFTSYCEEAMGSLEEGALA